MEADLLWTDMEQAVDEAGGPTSKLTQLHLDLTPDMDPDTATGQIAYDKGATFLRTIEQAVGREKRSEEHTSELQSLMRISYAVFCLKKKNPTRQTTTSTKQTIIMSKSPQKIDNKPPINQ